MTQLTLSAIVDLYERLGSRHYGEAVTQIDHALQCAHLADLDGAPDSLVAAALLHDIGHLLDADGEDLLHATDERHEVSGSARLAELFPFAVTQPVALHVAAKRYLCAREADYWAGLSDASKHSLALQGGPFTEEQAARFETLPHFSDAVQLRRYDDTGKKTGEAPPPFAAYVDRLARLVRA